MHCETCNNKHDGKYGSGRFCNSKCARSFSTKSKRKEINKKVSKTLKGYKIISGGKIKICDYGCGQEAKYQLSNKKWCCKDSFNTCPNIRKKNSNGVKKAHINGHMKGYTAEDAKTGRIIYRQKLKEIYLTLPFEQKPDPERRRIVLKEQVNKCIICGIEKWNKKLLKLHLDHIDGNRKNNKRDNLRFVCPNCHSQTTTYCRGSAKNISDEILKQLLIKTNFNFTKTLESVGLVAGGYNWKRITKIAKNININARVM